MEAARAVMAAQRVARAGVPPRGCRGTARGTEVWLARVRNGAAEGALKTLFCNFAKRVLVIPRGTTARAAEPFIEDARMLA